MFSKRFIKVIESDTGLSIDTIKKNTPEQTRSHFLRRPKRTKELTDKEIKHLQRPFSILKRIWAILNIVGLIVYSLS